MSEVRVNNLSNENNTGGPTISGITTYSGSHFFVPPQGDTASRPQSCPSGSLRFNTDTAHLEYYRGDTIGWVEIEAEEAAPLSGRLLRGGGEDAGTSADTNIIEFIETSTTGNALDFGDLIRAQRHTAALSNNTRGIFAGGYQTGDGGSNVIESVEIATLGNTTNFGDVTMNSNDWDFGMLANMTRGIIAGNADQTNQIEFITLMSTGNAVDFGDLVAGARSVVGLASPTRGVMTAGSPSNSNTMQYITIASTGNAQDFGDLVGAHGGATYNKPSGSNGTRGLFGPSGGLDIERITISSTGNAVQFGESAVYTTLTSSTTGNSDKLRMFIGSGGQPAINTIEFVTMATDGNAVDFGDFTTAVKVAGSCCNAQGGI